MNKGISIVNTLNELVSEVEGGDISVIEIGNP